MAWTDYYVSVAGGGAHNGTTEADAWTLAEAVAANAGGERVNVKTGAYSSAGLALSACLVATPLLYRGYKTTPGDLDGQGRNVDGTLNTTNFPVITLTGAIVPGTYTFMQNCVITGGLASAIINNAAISNVGYTNCSITNTLNNAAARAVNLGSYCCFVNCDISCTGAVHTTVFSGVNLIRIIGCRLKATDSSKSLLVAASGVFYKDVFIGFAVPGTSIAFSNSSVTGASPVAIMGCTFYGFAIVYQPANGDDNGMPALFADCVITDCTEYIHALTTANEQLYIESNLRLRDVTTPRTHTMVVTSGKEVTTDTGGPETDYVSITTGDLRLIPSSPARLAGMMPSSDCGAYQSGGSGGISSRPLRSSGRSS